MPPRYLVAILLIAVLLGALRLNRFTSAYDDEARFLMLAESLRFQGRYDLFDGMEHQFPPGLPALFAAAMWLTGTGQPLDTAILPAKVAVLLLHLLALALLYDLLARSGPRWVALVTVLALAVSPLLTSLATEPMSDVPFVAAAILTLWLLDRATPASSHLLWAAFAGLAAGLTCNIRLVGAVLVVAGGLYLLMTRRWLAAGVFVTLALLCLAPWLLYNRFDPVQRAETTAALSTTSYLGAVTSVDLYEPAASAPTLADYWGRLRFNTRTGVLALSAVLLGQPWRRLPVGPFPAWSGKLDVGFGLLLAGLILLGLFVGLRRRQWLFLLYLAGMQAILLVWPFFQQRYLLPLLPFYFFYLFLALDWLKQQAQSPPPLPRLLTSPLHPSAHQPVNRSTTLAIALFVGGIILFLIATNLNAGLRLFSLRHAPTVADYYRPQNAAWSSYFEATHWLTENAPPTTTTAARKPYLVYLFDDRRAVAFPWSFAASDWHSYLTQNNVTYVIEDAFSWSDVTDRFLRPVLRADPSAFQLVYTSPPPVTRIWRFVGNAVDK